MKRKFQTIEDVHDLAIVEQRKNEPAITYGEVLKRLKKGGFIFSGRNKRLDSVLKRMRTNASKKRIGAKDIDLEIKTARSRRRSPA